MYPPLSSKQAQNENKIDLNLNRYIYEKIDWLSVSFPHNIKISQLAKYLPDAMLNRIKSPIPVYRLAYEYGYAKFLAGHPNAGVHMILSGKPLDGLRMIHEYSLDKIFLMIKECRGKVSRIDFAVDVVGEQRFTVKEVHRRFKKEECVTRLKGSKYIGEIEDETLYIGKMNSKSRRFRVYDKSVELGNVAGNYVRVEYEKRRGAMSTYNAYISGQKISSIIVGAVNFPTWGLWRDIMGSAKAIIPREYLESGDDDIQSKIDWIEKSAAGAIAKVAFEQYMSGECDDIHDAPIFDTLSGSIASKLRKLMNTIIEN